MELYVILSLFQNRIILYLSLHSISSHPSFQEAGRISLIK